MTLPASGNPISFSQINTELGLTSTAQISMNDAAVRTLFGVASGAIAMSNGFGKSSGPQPVFDIDAKAYTGSGTTIVGSTPGTPSGTLVNSPAWTSASPTYFSYNGVNQYITSAVPAITTVFNTTMECWVKITTPAGSPFMSLGSNTTGISFGVGNFGYGSAGINLILHNPMSQMTIVKSFTATNQWYHAVVTFETTNSSWKFYMNGVLFATTTSPVVNISGTPTVTISRFQEDTLTPYYGSLPIALARVYNVALTATEVLTRYNNTKARFGQ